MIYAWRGGGKKKKRTLILGGLGLKWLKEKVGSVVGMQSYAGKWRVQGGFWCARQADGTCRNISGNGRHAKVIVGLLPSPGGGICAISYVTSVWRLLTDNLRSHPHRIRYSTPSARRRSGRIIPSPRQKGGKVSYMGLDYCGHYAK